MTRERTYGRRPAAHRPVSRRRRPGALVGNASGSRKPVLEIRDGQEKHARAGSAAPPPRAAGFETAAVLVNEQVVKLYVYAESLVCSSLSRIASPFAVPSLVKECTVRDSGFNVAPEMWRILSFGNGNSTQGVTLFGCEPVSFVTMPRGASAEGPAGAPDSPGDFLFYL